MTDEIRAGLVKAGLGIGLLFLLVTGRIQDQVARLTGAVSGAPASSQFVVRDLITKREPIRGSKPV